MLSVRFCTDASCHRRSRYRFCNACYRDRTRRITAIYDSQISSVEERIAELKALEQNAAGLLARFMERLIAKEQEARSMRDDESVTRLRERMQLETRSYVLAKRKSDELMLHLMAGIDGLKARADEDLAALSRRQIVATSVDRLQ